MPGNSCRIPVWRDLTRALNWHTEPKFRGDTPMFLAGSMFDSDTELVHVKGTMMGFPLYFNIVIDIFFRLL